MHNCARRIRRRHHQDTRWNPKCQIFRAGKFWEQYARSEYIKKSGITQVSNAEALNTTSETVLASLPDKDRICESASEVNPYEGENSGNGAKFSMWAAKNWYDYGKTFAEQIDDWKQGKIPKYDTLVVGQTSEVLRKIGMAALPMTIDQTHVGYALNGSYNADHQFSETEFQNMPELLNDPVAITASRSHRDTSMAVEIEMKNANGKQATASVAGNWHGKMNQERIGAYAITSVDGRNNTITMMQQAAQDEANGNMSVFYLLE